MKTITSLVHKYINTLFIFSLVFSFACTNVNKHPVIPKASNQLILVLSDSVTATNGLLYTFARENASMKWKQLTTPTKVVLGRNGLGNGVGLHDLSNLESLPTKKEGDGRSPAGIFNLGAVFGYNSREEMSTLKMPYLHITEMSECIDDVNSKYYNQIVLRDKIETTDTIDWTSSEKMRSAGIYYELGIIVEHNSNLPKTGAGSCIFLHNWADSSETMAGCTAMSTTDMAKIAFWVDKEKNPILVQLTKQLYSDLLTKWKLPEIRTK